MKTKTGEQRMNEGDIKELYSSHFCSFLEFAFEELHPGEELQPNWHIEVLANYVRSCFDGDTTRFIVNLPPRSLKSFCVSIAFVAFLLGNDPTRRFMVLCGNQGLATDLLTRVRRLMRSARYGALFPKTLINSETADIRLTSGGGAFYGVYGQSAIGRGADYIIVDDPIAPQHANDAERRSACNEWFDTEVLPRLNDKDKGVIIVVMQRLHCDDLVGYLCGKSLWRGLVLPAIALRDEVFKTPLGLHTRKRGEPLIPERETKETLRDILMEMGGLAFRAQYLQSPSCWHLTEQRTEFMYANPENPPEDGIGGGLIFVYQSAEVLKYVFGESTYLDQYISMQEYQEKYAIQPEIIDLPSPGL